MSRIGIMWFRRDLRLGDNPALRAALQACEWVIPLYVQGEDAAGSGDTGAASRWWLHGSLEALGQSLAARGSRLILRSGEPARCLLHLVEETGASEVYWNGLSTPAEQGLERRVQQALQASGVRGCCLGTELLHDPQVWRTGAGRPYRMFTPFYRFWGRSLAQRVAPLPAPRGMPPLERQLESLALERLALLPKVAWDQGLREAWQPGESGARQRLGRFCRERLTAYAEWRDRPAADATSRLSAHLHFGEISARQVLSAVDKQVEADPSAASGARAFVRQLVWREFAHHLLFHFPESVGSPMDPRFRRFPWRSDYGADLRAWQQGRTGYPLVDAGMRQLWRSGWMHNRIRLVVASFLTKNLLIPWQEGAAWFWDTLVDADLANNTLGWQWVAGSGADAAPFFRIFNPILQGERFDPQGDYVRRWVPELARLPARWIHRPWLAPAPVLQVAGLTLGVDYPLPRVDLARSRRQALAAFEKIRKAGG